MSKMNVGESCFSSGPIMDTTPHEAMTPVPVMNSSIPECCPPLGVLKDSAYSGINQYEVPAEDSAFSRLENKLSHEKGVYNPAGLAAKIGREKIGEKEMARRSAEAREHHK